jgi:RNA polymerase sigma factor (sigma-70 family)
VEALSELVQRAKGGELDAYDAVVRRTQDLAVGYAYALLGDFHLAQDAAQEAFLAAYLALPQLREPAAFPAWFRTILRKQCDRLTRGRRVPTVPLEQATPVAGAGGDPEEAALLQALREEVRASLRALSEGERSVVSLYYMGGHSQGEISAFLELPVSTIKNRLHSARKRLRQRMITIMKDDLSAQRPSRDDQFAAAVVEMLRAAKTGDRKKVQTLLDKDGSLVGPQDDPAHGHDQVTALHYAAEKGQIDVAAILLDRGADINAVELSHQLPPIGWATTFPRMQREMAEFLIARGARLDLFVAAAMGMTGAVEAFVRQDPSQVHARLTANNGALQALHLAAREGHRETVARLLTLGADPTAKDGLGKTPLAWAEEKGHTEVAALLRGHGKPGP